MKTDVLIATVLLGWKEDRSFPDKGRVFRSPGGALEMDTTFKFKTDYNELMKAFSSIETMGYTIALVSYRVGGAFSGDKGHAKYIVEIHDDPKTLICSFNSYDRLEAMYLAVCHFALWISKGKPKIEI